MKVRAKIKACQPSYTISIEYGINLFDMPSAGPEGGFFPETRHPDSQKRPQRLNVMNELTHEVSDLSRRRFFRTGDLLRQLAPWLLGFLF
jgi:hypothetical protein